MKRKELETSEDAAYLRCVINEEGHALNGQSGTETEVQRLCSEGSLVSVATKLYTTLQSSPVQSSPERSDIVRATNGNDFIYVTEISEDLAGTARCSVSQPVT